MAASKLESKSVDEVCEWLDMKGFPDSVVDTFREQELDGSAIAMGLASTPGPDWIKDIIPVLGIRLKVHNALRALANEDMPISNSPPEPALSSPEARSPASSVITTISVGHSSGQSSATGSTPASCGKVKVETFPQPFPIPKFRSRTEANLLEKLLTDADRKHMVQTLATILMTYNQHPSLKQCGLVAKALRGTPPNEAMEKENNQPHIVLFKDDDEDEFNQYFIAIEQQLMMESSNIVSAIFLCVAAHYVFNLSYHRKSGDVWLFVQEKMLHLPSKGGIKRHPSAISHFSEIQRVFDSLCDNN